MIVVEGGVVWWWEPASDLRKLANSYALIPPINPRTSR